MKADEFAQSLGLPNEKSYFKDTSFVITLKDSDEFSKIYTLLDESEDLDMNPDTFQMDEHLTSIDYDNEEFNVNIRADFQNKEYTIIVQPIE